MNSTQNLGSLGEEFEDDITKSENSLQEFLTYLEGSKEDIQQITNTQSETISLNQNPTKKHKARISNKPITYRLDTKLYCESAELKNEYEKVLLPLLISASKKMQANGEGFSQQGLAKKIGITPARFADQFSKHPPTVKFKNDLYNYYIEHPNELDENGPRLLKLLSDYKRKKYALKNSVSQNTQSVTTIESPSIDNAMFKTITLVPIAETKEPQKSPTNGPAYSEYYLFGANNKKQSVKNFFERLKKPEPIPKRQKPNS